MGKLAQGDVDGLLGPADRAHRTAGQSSGQRINLVIKLISGNDMVDQPNTLGLCRGH